MLSDPVGSWVAGSGFSAIHNINNGTFELTSEWRADNDTTVDSSWDAAFDTQVGGIAVEIKAAAGGGGATGISGQHRIVYRIKRHPWRF